MPDFEMELPPTSGLVKPGSKFEVKSGYIYTGGPTPEASSLRLNGWFEVVEQVADAQEPAWWCRMNDSGPTYKLQICIREADILAYTTPAKS